MEAFGINASPLLQWLLKTTIQGSVLVCLILLIKLVLRQKLLIRWHYCLWLLLLARLAMPWAPQSRISMFNLMPQSVPQQRAEPTSRNDSTGNGETDSSGGYRDTERAGRTPDLATSIGAKQSELPAISEDAPKVTAAGSGSRPSDPIMSTHMLWPGFWDMLSLLWLITEIESWGRRRNGRRDNSGCFNWPGPYCLEHLVLIQTAHGGAVCA